MYTYTPVSYTHLVIGFAIGTVGVIGGVFVTLACVCYLTYCAFGVKTAKA